MQTIGYAAEHVNDRLTPFSFERRQPRENDVAIEILYCGVCHSDLHNIRNDFGMSTYPLVPGHEIVGRVTAVGAAVTSFKPGDAVAVGCMVDSCQHCDNCHKGLEMFCREGMTMTYGSADRVDGTMTYGGYSRHMVVREEFVLAVPESLDLARVAPLLCAGITTYSPLRQWQVGPGSRVGVVGMGGLGHMAIKLAAGLGAEVTVISRSAAKEADARELGADSFLLSTDAAAMEAHKDRFDVIIDTVPVEHDINPYIPLLDIEGTHVLVGHIGPLETVMTPALVFGRRRVVGSLIGGIAETQELLDFCGKAGILPEVEMIAMGEINEAFERMERGDVRYRFVIDMASLDQQAAA